MTSPETDCPVCGHPGFERARLPETCPQCGWTVDNLIQPSKTYLRKLDTAKREWLASGGTPQVRAKRLVALFEQIDAAWKAGRWTEVMGCYDEIQSIHPDNARASRERTVALFCLMESLLQRQSTARQEAMKKETARDRETIERLQAEATRCMSVGMAKEAEDLLEQASELARLIDGREKDEEVLADNHPVWFTTRYQPVEPKSLKGDRTDFESLLSAPYPSWKDEQFYNLLWKPLLQNISDLPDDERRYVEAFQSSYFGHVRGSIAQFDVTRWVKNPASGIIEDRQTGLEWLVGPDMDTSHHGAVSFVERLADRWRLPSLAELTALYDAGIRKDDWGPFENSAWFVWSDEQRDPQYTWAFHFRTGDWHRVPRDNFDSGKRVFAVRYRNLPKNPHGTSHLGGRFWRDPASGVVEDVQADLEWLVGPDEDVDFDKAKSWIEGLEGNWRHPVREELKALHQTILGYDQWGRRKNVAERTDWGPFMTTGEGVWTGEEVDSTNAFRFDLHSGWFLKRAKTTSEDSRVFAVRRRIGGPQ